MSDVIFGAVVVAFFALPVAYVRGCARIVGDDDVVRVEADAAVDETGGPAAADAERVS